MDVIMLRKKLNEVDGKTWSELGYFFSNYVSDEELERWLLYQDRHGHSYQDSDLHFDDMLVYFLESVFENAEKYDKKPKILKSFCESNNDELIELGLRLRYSILTYKNERQLIDLISKIDYPYNPNCQNCGCLKFVDKAISIINR